MKQKLSGFIAGALVTTLLGALTVTALAATGKLTIDVYPINIQVNDTTFQPTDVNGDTVPVFTYNGTTYAPLRALANAYGLEVGYDAEKNIATVNEKTTTTPDTTAPSTDYSDWSAEEEAAYQDFKAMWDVTINKHVDGTGTSYNAVYSGDLEYSNLRILLLNIGEDKFSSYAIRLLDAQSSVAEEQKTLMFYDKIPGHVIGRADILWRGSSKSASFTETFRNS